MPPRTPTSTAVCATAIAIDVAIDIATATAPPRYIHNFNHGSSFEAAPLQQASEAEPAARKSRAAKAAKGGASPKATAAPPTVAAMVPPAKGAKLAKDAKVAKEGKEGKVAKGGSTGPPESTAAPHLSSPGGAAGAGTTPAEQTARAPPSQEVMVLWPGSAEQDAAAHGMAEPYAEHSHRCRPREELYDTLVDPLETHNLAGLPQHATRQRNLWNKLRAWMAKHDDVDPVAQERRVPVKHQAGTSTCPAPVVAAPAPGITCGAASAAAAAAALGSDTNGVNGESAADWAVDGDGGDGGKEAAGGWNTDNTFGVVVALGSVSILVGCAVLLYARPLWRCEPRELCGRQPHISGLHEKPVGTWALKAAHAHYAVGSTNATESTTDGNTADNLEWDLEPCSDDWQASRGPPRAPFRLNGMHTGVAARDPGLVLCLCTWPPPRPPRAPGHVSVTKPTKSRNLP